MTRHSHSAPRSSGHPHAAAMLDAILLIAAVVAVVAVAIVASSSITGLEPGTLPSPTPVGY